MPLSKKQLLDICLVNGGPDCCRYLRPDDLHHDRWYCMKKNAVKKAEIDEEIEDFIRDLSKKKINPDTQGVALGDNCKGYPVMKYIEQGYDC